MASIISTLFRLDSATGTDPLNIVIGPNLSVDTPQGSGSLTTSTNSSDAVVEYGQSKDAYVFVRNTGSSTAGNLAITDGGVGNTIGLLKPGDFLFLPLKGDTGLRIKYDTAVTTADWFYWCRK
tara:strand:+ start:144 stop:512 length:369 start_codon:yes stop_codon:yes gene_type:complete